MAAEDSLRVGYRRPPARTQFKKGQSGNPKGRPKGARGFRTEFLEELAEVCEVRDGEAVRVVSKQRAIIKALVRSALGGDTRAMERVVDLSRQLEAERDSAPSTSAASTDVFHDYVENEVAKRVAAKLRGSK